MLNNRPWKDADSAEAEADEAVMAVEVSAEVMAVDEADKIIKRTDASPFFCILTKL